MLLIDAGNTRAEWRYIAGDNKVEGNSYYQDFKLACPQEPQRVIIAAVSAQSKLERLLPASYLKKTTWLTQPQVEYPNFKHCYVRPERLGVDRWLAMLGARSHYASGVLVVDAGTALTVDVLTAENHHLGGYIVPGLTMAQQALFAGTDKIKPYIDEHPHSDIQLGMDTLSCVHFGLERQRLSFVQSVQQQFADYELLVTGGDGINLAKQLQATYYNNLVLDGMESLCAGYLLP